MRGLINEPGPKAARSRTRLVHKTRRLQGKQSLLQELIPRPKYRRKMGNKYSPSQFSFPFPESKTECPNLEFRAPAMIPSYHTLLGRQNKLSAGIIPKEYSTIYLQWLINAICPFPRMPTESQEHNWHQTQHQAGSVVPFQCLGCGTLKLWAVLKP